MFFESGKDERDLSYCEPLYYIPQLSDELNPTRRQVMDWTDEQLNEYLIKLQKYLVDLFEKDNISFFGSTMDRARIIKTLQALDELNTINNKDIFEDGFITGFQHFELAINHWFPEMVSIDVNSAISILDAVKDFIKLKKKFYRTVVENRLKNYKSDLNTVFPPFKYAFKVASGNQTVTNIRCTVAKWIYQNVPKDPGEFIVWDPSMGWAGRLASFLAAARQSSASQNVYIGTDPNTKIKDRYLMIKDFWSNWIRPLNNTEVYPLCCGSEVAHEQEIFQKYIGKGNLVYTSPPYFDKEHYSDETTQSYLKFPVYEQWRDGFLRPTIQNASMFLKPGGYMYWNIADIKRGSVWYTLEDDSKKFAEEFGLEYKYILYMRMGANRFPGAPNSKNLIMHKGNYVKFEPVFVFQKR